MSELFAAFRVRGLTARNRIVMPPMSQASADERGRAQVWHLVHYGSRAVGGVGLIVLEDTAVSPDGRLNMRALGLYSDDQVPSLCQITEFCRLQGAKVGIQLAHAGPKAWGQDRGRGPFPLVSPSGLRFAEDWSTPDILGREEIRRLVRAWGAAAERAVRAGFEFVEVHAAHGYLLNAFLSPLTNQREDEYGRDRGRFLIEVTESVRASIPSEMPLFVRLSASDLAPEGLTPDDIEALARRLVRSEVDVLDLSWGGISSAQQPMSLSARSMVTRRIKERAGLPVIAVGLAASAADAEELIATGTADLVAVGRSLLRHPYWALTAADELSCEISWPRQYAAAAAAGG